MSREDQSYVPLMRNCLPCGKNMYPDTEEGNRLVNKVIERTKGIQLHSYYCPWGNGIHLTKRPQDQFHHIQKHFIK